MKLSKVIPSLIVLIALCLCNKAFAFDNFAHGFGIKLVTKTIGKGTKHSDTTSLQKASSAGSFYLKTSTQNFFSSRIEERSFLDALFLSFNAFNKIHRICTSLQDKALLHFVPHALKIIYPHHYFW